jgi:hypothetical protein
MILGAPLVTTILDRARDPQGIATTRASCLSLASTCQQVTNGAVGDVIVTNSLTMPPRTLIYQLSVYLPDCLKIHTIRDSSNRDLSWLEGGVNELAQIDLSWPFQVASQPRCWAMAGRDLLIMYPGVNTATTVNVVYTQITPALKNEANDSTVVANETDYAVMTLTELLLLLKARDYAAFAPALKRYQEQVSMLKAQEK